MYFIVCICFLKYFQTCKSILLLGILNPVYNELFFLMYLTILSGIIYPGKSCSLG